MLGPKHVPTYLECVNFESDLTKHHQKLASIHGNSKKHKEFLDQHADEKVKLFETRERGLKFHQSERLLAIEKDNELLLGKLVEISRKKKTVADFKSDKHNVGTLNAPHRKREKNRIAAENEAFARRLLSQQPSFNRKKLELDYGKHNERVKQMKKVNMFSPRVKLPPLQKDEPTMRKSKSGNTLTKKEERQRKLEEIQRAEEERQEQELEALKQKEKEEQEQKEKEEKEEKERKEQEEKEAQEKAEHEKAEKEKVEREKAEEERKEKEEKELAEKKAKEEQERLAKEAAEKEALNNNNVEHKSPEQLQKEKDEENAKWQQLDKKDNKNDAMMGMFRGMVPTK